MLNRDLFPCRYWTDYGIGWASNSTVQDVDDTSMGFRLLRLHGFNVSEGEIVQGLQLLGFLLSPYL